MENTGFKLESRISYFIHLQNEEDCERKESSSVEKPRDFDPFGQTGLPPLATI